MSVERCSYCDVNIDTDWDAEHFDVLNPAARCIIEEQDLEEN